MKKNVKKKKQKILPIHVALGAAGIVILILLFVGLSALIENLTSNKEYMELTDYYNITEESQVPVIINDTVLDSHASMINGQLYLDYNLVNTYINSRYYWDANENVLLYTTANDVISADAEATSYFIGKSSKDFGQIIVKSTADSALINIDFLKLHSDFTYNYYESPSRIVIRSEWTEVTVATAKKNTELRFEGSKDGLLLGTIEKNSTLTVLEEGKDWNKVCTPDGIVGYVKSDHLKDITKQTLSSDFIPEEFFHILKDEPINLLWHDVDSSDDNGKISDVLSNTKGVNVVSPTWFTLKDNKGNVSNLASRDYVDYCRNHNVEVWGMVSNTNSTVDTTAVLTHTSSRQNLVNQLVAAALQYNFDGINIDFTNLDQEAIGDGYIQFIRELSIKCENNDISLSINIPASTVDSDFHHYEEQSLFVDYVIVKAFNEHIGQQTGEGSIASLPWVRQQINTVQSKGVPSNQIVLGVPLYTKLWTLTPTSATNETYMISSTTMGMSTSQNWMNNNVHAPEWLDDCQQWYGETTSNGIIYKMWLEDSTSIEQKLLFMQEETLAGAAFYDYYWSNTNIWDTIIKYVN